MDAMPYVDTLFKEYLLFRGFTHTLTAFQADLAQDPGCGFSAPALTDLVFRQLIPQHRGADLIALLDFLNMRLCSRLDARYDGVVHGMEVALIKHLLATAAAAGRRDKVSEFLTQFGADLLSGSDSDDWRPWFTLAHLQQPQKLPAFQVYFTPEWAALLRASFTNFLQSLLGVVPLPAVLAFNTDRRLRLAMQQQVDALQQQVKALEQQLAAAAAAAVVVGQTSQPVLVKAVADVAVQAGGTDKPGPLLGQAAGVVAGHKREASLGDWTHLHMTGTSSGGGSSSGSGVAGRGRSSLAGHSSVSGSPGDASATGAGSLQQRQQQVGEPVELRPLGGSSSSGSARGLGLSRSAQGFQGAAAAAVAEADKEALIAAAGTAPAAHGLTLSPVRPSISVPAPSSISTPPGTPDLTPTAAAAAAAGAGAGAGFQEAGGVGGTAAQAVPAAALNPAAAAAGVAGGAGDSSGTAAAAAATSSSGGSGVLSGSPVLSWTGAHLSGQRYGPPGGFYPGTSPPSRGYLSGGELSQRPLSTSSSRRNRSSTDESSGLPGAGSAAGGGGGGTSGGGAMTDAAWTPETLLPVAARLPAEVVQPLQALTSGLTACAWSPSGDNVATACADGAVGVWCAPGVSGNAGRVANISCGVAVTSLCWDGRADKVMLLGCSGGAGVRVWHADQRRTLEQVTGDTSYPAVTAVATCPSEPCFVVAAATSAAPTVASTASAAGAAGVGQPQGRLTTYNSRSFKRSAVYSIPGEPTLCSLAYNRSGTVLAAGSTTGRVYLLDPGGRASPIRAWSVLPKGDMLAWDPMEPAAVQVAWRPVQSAAAAGGGSNAGASTAAVVVGSPSSSSGTLLAAGGSSSGSGSETLVTCSRGVLAEWSMGSGGSQGPLAAVDVAGAAAAALTGSYLQSTSGSADPTADQPPPPQQQQQQSGEQLVMSDVQSAGMTSCAFGLSSDGRWCAVVCGAAERGCVLLYDLQAPASPDGAAGDTGAAAVGSRSGLGRVAPVVLLVTEALAGPRVVIDWRPGQGLGPQSGASSSSDAASAAAAEGSTAGTHVLLVGGSKGVAITLKVQL